MAISEDLFELVGVLSKSEKRYCRLYIERRVGREASNLLRLFDAIVRQPDRDSTKLRRQLAGASFLNHLSVTKTHLYKLLLKALRSYAADSSDEWRLREMIDAARILYSRRLYTQARSLVDQAVKRATQLDLPLTHLELLDLDNSIDDQGLYRDEEGRGLSRRYKEGRRLIRVVENYWEYRSLRARLLYLANVAGQQRGAASRKRLDALVRRHPLLQSEHAALSMTTKGMFYETLMLYHVSVGDYNGAYKVMSQELLYQESIDDPLNSGEAHQNRRITLRNHVRFCANVGKIEEACVSFRKLMTPHPSDAAWEDHLALLRCEAEVDICMAGADYERLIDLGQRIEQLCQSDSLPEASVTRTVSRLNTAYAHMMRGEYRDAVSWLAKDLNDPPARLYDQHEVLARIYRIICHYELEDLDLLPYLLRSFYRFLRRRNRLHPFEQIILRLLRRLTGVTTRLEVTEIFRMAREEIFELGDDPRELETSPAGAVLPWLDSKIDGTSTAEAGRLRCEQRMKMAELI